MEVEEEEEEEVVVMMAIKFHRMIVSPVVVYC
jgi:hypothetical protein